MSNISNVYETGIFLKLIAITAYICDFESCIERMEVDRYDDNIIENESRKSLPTS